MIHSHSLLFSDFDTKWYKIWAKELKQNNKNLDGHKLKANKFWQNAVIAQSLYERGLLRYGVNALGFGTGQERLPALFAKNGVHVIATDQDYRNKKAKHWEKNELTRGIKSLNKLTICSPEIFKKNVSYRPLDMTKIPSDLSGKFNFVWSNCALGHLGSIKKGLEFIVNSSECLKPDGIAIHTTEINILSNDNTLDNNKDTVIFRPIDIHRLWQRLQLAGYDLSPLRLNLGNTLQDEKINMSPEFGNDYSKLQVGGYLLTQIVLIIKKKSDNTKAPTTAKRIKENYLYI